MHGIVNSITKSPSDWSKTLLANTLKRDKDHPEFGQQLGNSMAPEKTGALDINQARAKKAALGEKNDKHLAKTAQISAAKTPLRSSQTMNDLRSNKEQRKGLRSQGVGNKLPYGARRLPGEDLKSVWNEYRVSTAEEA